MLAYQLKAKSSSKKTLLRDRDQSEYNPSSSIAQMETQWGLWQLRVHFSCWQWGFWSSTAGETSLWRADARLQGTYHQHPIGAKVSWWNMWNVTGLWGDTWMITWELQLLWSSSLRLVDTEIEILKVLNHPHVLQLFEVYFEPSTTVSWQKVRGCQIWVDSQSSAESFWLRFWLSDQQTQQDLYLSIKATLFQDSVLKAAAKVLRFILGMCQTLFLYPEERRRKVYLLTELCTGGDLYPGMQERHCGNSLGDKPA